MLITQAVEQDTRSVLMTVMNGLKFQCTNTTCTPFLNLNTRNVLTCQMACLAQTECKAATFHLLTSNCELFTNMSNQNVNMVADLDTVSMNII
ncbi:unnamed protein product, partial [Adineta steineri]